MTSPRQINRLDKRLSFKLVNHVLEHYAVSGQTDIDFAKSAGETLGIPLTAKNILSARQTVDIPSNKAVAQASKGDISGSRIAQLLRRIDQRYQRTVALLRPDGAASAGMDSFPQDYPQRWKCD